MIDNATSQLRAVTLSEQCKQIILGGLLGDSCLTITKNYRNARYQFRHSILQEGYFLWKFNHLNEISPPKPQYTKPDGVSKNRKIGFMSKALPSLTLIYNIVSPSATSLVEIDKKWLGYLNELALFVWWVDDGSIVGNGKRGTFCCDGFGLPAIQILKDYLKNKWDITCTIGLMNRKAACAEGIQYKRSTYYRLYLNNTELRKFFMLIMPFLETPSLLKKFTLRYKDPICRQRWISTMKKALPQFHAEIDLII